MQIKLNAVVLLILLAITSCSKKNHPQTAIVKNQTEAVTIKAEVAKPVYKKIKTPPLPKVITLDDRGAKKAVDGRLYYDLEGKRYWRNYDDGKYYQYKEGLFNDPAFKPH